MGDMASNTASDGTGAGGPSGAPASRRELRQALGPIRATALVVGTIIGTGVFLKPAKMAAAVGSSELVLAAWIVAGVLSVAGALTYAELGARLPKAGGEYAYLKVAYGSWPAFMFGWMRFWIGSPGSIAAFGVGAATFLGAVFPVADWPGGTAGLAVVLILGLTLLNVLTVTVGAGVQTALTVLKVLAIVGLALALFALGRSPDAPAAAALTPLPEAGFSAFVTAVLAALWAFDGWNNLPMVGSEVASPRRNIPLALVCGMAVVATLYLLADRAYFHVLDVGEVAAAAEKGALPVATEALRIAAGPGSETGAHAVTIMSLVFVVSALGAMTGSILTGARVPYAMARDGLFHGAFASVSEAARVPSVAVLVQGAIACILALSGTFDQLTDAVVFASWIFYGLTALALFRLRALKVGEELLTYRVPLFPVLPLLFVALALVLLVNTVATAPELTAIGVGVMALGALAYPFMRRPASTQS